MRSALVVDTHELGRGAGASRHVRREAEAPPDLGNEVVGVRPGSVITVDVMLESAVEGVLVTGSAVGDLQGECVRCLDPVSGRFDVELMDLYAYPESGATDDEARRLIGDLLDLEPLVRDAVVLELPFQPLCRPDCAGLCPECGANLNREPRHSHAAAVDPRWAALRTVDTGRPEDFGSAAP